MKSKTKCACGSEFPMHMAECGLTAYVCMCERAYAVEWHPDKANAVFRLTGTEPNPFARARKPTGRRSGAG